jgi:hypothetical protein
MGVGALASCKMSDWGIWKSLGGQYSKMKELHLSCSHQGCSVSRGNLCTDVLSDMDLPSDERFN